MPWVSALRLIHACIIFMSVSRMPPPLCTSNSFLIACFVASGDGEKEKRLYLYFVDEKDMSSLYLIILA